jgi:hypothetical protein
VEARGSARSRRPRFKSQIGVDSGNLTKLTTARSVEPLTHRRLRGPDHSHNHNVVLSSGALCQALHPFCHSLPYFPANSTLSKVIVKRRQRLDQGREISQQPRYLPLTLQSRTKTGDQSGLSIMIFPRASRIMRDIGSSRDKAGGLSTM